MKRFDLRRDFLVFFSSCYVRSRNAEETIFAKDRLFRCASARNRAEEHKKSRRKSNLQYGID